MKEKMLDMEERHEIMSEVMRAQIDYAAYVNLDSEELGIILTKEKDLLLPPEIGNYTEAANKQIIEYVHPEDVVCCMRQLQLSSIKTDLKSKEQISVEFRFLCGREYRRKKLDIRYFEKDNRYLIFVRRDIMERYEEEERQKEKIVQALAEARHANQSKGDFLARMSHEIRTPMNSIIGLAYLSKENVENKKQLLENLDKIDVSARFLLSFVDDILNLSQIECGNVAMHQETVDLELFLSELKSIAGAIAYEKQIHFAMEIRGTFWKKYRFDVKILKRALLNILQNAVKFTQPEGRVDFIVELVSETKHQSMFRFEVRDTGIGMDEKFLPHAFDPFEQEDTGVTTLYGGTGLGLTISKNIIDYMDGKIDVYSRKENGSTFVVTVGVEKVAEEEDALKRQGRSRAVDYDFSGKRVLLVEDNEINIDITKNILLHKYLEVDTAVNGEEGLKQFLSHNAGYYDAILMDIRMPVMDGHTATRKIRSLDRADAKQIPIIAMTANVFEEDVKKSFEAGMNAHLSKPVDIKQMYLILDDMILNKNV